MEWSDKEEDYTKIEPRYMHAAALVDDYMYVIGGVGARHRQLSDTKIVSVRGWSCKEGPPCPIPCSGHGVITRGDVIMVFGGTSSSPGIPVLEFNTWTSTWSCVTTTGQIPVPRRGHSVSLVGSKVVMFGGETTKGCSLNDLYVLHLDSMSWEQVNASGTAVSPRSGHGAFVVSDRDVFVFGGRSASTFYNDLYVLDTATMKWSLCSQSGSVPSPRAYFASTGFMDKWFISGGGDSETGAGLGQTLALDIKALRWEAPAADAPEVACEGMSLVSYKANPAFYIMLAFGGNNGKSCSNKMPTLYVPCRLDDPVEVTLGHNLARRNMVDDSGALLLRLLPRKTCRWLLEKACVTISDGQGMIKPTQTVDDVPEPILLFLKETVTSGGLQWVDSNLRLDFGCSNIVRFPFRVAFEPTAAAGRGQIGPGGVYPSRIHLVFWVKQQVDEEARWQGRMLLFAATVLCRGAINPALVTTDLGEEWWVSWMDGYDMYEFRCMSRSQALGIIKDLAQPGGMNLLPSSHKSLGMTPVFNEDDDDSSDDDEGARN